MKENYPIFVKWMTTLDWILDRCEALPRSVRFSISTRISNHALDVLEGIIECIYTKDRTQILNRLNLYIEKLRVLFRICHTRGYISGKQYEYIAEELTETGNMIGGWRKSLK